MNGAIYVSATGNNKLVGSRPIDCTYVSINSCPSTCALKGKGCYAQVGRVGIHCCRLDKEAEELSALELARAEAKVINSSYRGGPVPEGRELRLHVSGDCRVVKGARLINNAVKCWQKRGGGAVFTFTHAWKNVPRVEWKFVSVLASVDYIADAQQAIQLGYAPAIVVAEHLSKQPYKLDGSNVKWIPCASQVRGTHCSECKLCKNADQLKEANCGIAFAAHGCRKEQLKKRLKVLNG